MPVMIRLEAARVMKASAATGIIPTLRNDQISFFWRPMVLWVFMRGSGWMDGGRRGAGLEERASLHDPRTCHPAKPVARPPCSPLHERIFLAWASWWSLNDQQRGAFIQRRDDPRAD